MKVAYVTPRYGVEVIGGAEQGARLLAEHLVEQLGWDVEAFTSCALDAGSWANEYPAGTADVNGVAVHRFHADGRAPDFEARSRRVLASPATVARADEAAWFRAQGPVSDELVGAVAASTADLVVFYPYLYHPTVAGLPQVAERAVMHPAAHDEPPLRLPVFREVFAAARGLVFQTEGERRLAESLFPIAHHHQIVMGLGADPRPGTPDAARSALGLDDRPYLLCIGRVDDGKGTRTLAEFFAAFRGRHPELALQLVLAGPVVHEPPAHPDVVVTGPVDEAVKWGLLRGALLLVNPSAFEAFSIVLIEAWSAGVPVLVNARCPATSEHVQRSGGGLAFDGYAAFDAALAALVDHPGRRHALAAGGRAYVDAFYRWPAIIERYGAFLERVAHGPLGR